MSSKNMAHSVEIIGRQSNRRSPRLLFIIGTILILALVATLVTIQSSRSGLSSNNSREAITYSNALAMQYAQPWLAKSQTAVASIAPVNDALEMQYAQPWLDQQQVEAMLSVPYSNALAMQYAQPWLAKQPVELVPDTLYSNALAIFYAQPWLDAQQANNCNGRLDMMYACQNGY